MDNSIHSFGVSCLADAVCSGKLRLVQESHLYLNDNPLGLEGSIAAGRMISSSHCQLSWAYLSRCKLTTAGINLSSTSSLNTVYSVAERDIGQQLCQMPQSSIIRILYLCDNSFTGEGIHILAGFIHLCPCMTYLHTDDCGITSDDLMWLLDRLTQLKSSSPNLCSKLRLWSLQKNLIDDSGVSALIDHLPSLFPRWGCDKYLDYNSFDNNLVSVEIMNRLKEEWRRQEEVSLSVS